VSEASLFAAGFIAAFVYGDRIGTLLAATGAGLRAWLAKRPD
jgi:hypothetical protein